MMNTREIILKSAQKLFARFGFAKTTIDEIAKKAHLAKSTLYHHFQSKEDIIRATVEREGQILNERIEAAVEAADSPQDKLRAYIVARLQHLKELTNFYSALTEEYLEHYSFIEKAREKDFQGEMSMLQGILSSGMQDGSFRIKHRDVEITAFALLTALKGLEYPWTSAAVVPEIEEHIDVLLGLLFLGILTDKPD